MQTSKFKKGDRVSYKNESGVVINCTVQSVGVLGGKLNPLRVYLYDIKPDEQSYTIHGILERSLTKIENDKNL